MPKRKIKEGNLRLAGIFIAVVLGLVFLSFVIKFIFVIRESRFDGAHKFNVLLTGKNEQDIVSFSPSTHSISELKLDTTYQDPAKSLEVPVDGEITVRGNLNVNNLSMLLFRSELPLGQTVQKLTFLDLLRLALFTRTVTPDSLYQREYSDNLSDSQKNTLISLTFTDPAIYDENLSIQVVNATDINGLGARFAAFVSNIGGNPILITNSDRPENMSKIIYTGKMSYTVQRLSSYFNLPVEKTDSRGIADVIIVIGKDFDNSL